jgi:Rrf2 family transcriptional regulator, iron-sulfur cluster assembly transcription factor
MENMMRLSTKARYAVRAMIDLSLNCSEGTVTRDEIADRQEISPLYLSHILLRLARAGLIGSAKGPGGGYYLGKDPSEIRVGDIVRAVGEPMELVSCIPNATVRCQRTDICAAHGLWTRLSEAVNTTMDSVTLAELCSEAREKMRAHSEAMAAVR